MSLFVCDKCGCVENTAYGHWWMRDRKMFKDDSLTGLALCSECMPDKFDDESNNPGGGKWHGKFPKKSWAEWNYCEVENRENKP